MARSLLAAADDAWRYERFVTTIQQRAGISWQEAEAAARATLQTLGERIAWGEVRDLADELPQDVAAWLTASGRGDAEPFDAKELVRRVAEREDVDAAAAERHVRAVVVALARLARDDEIEDMIAQLPKDYAPLVAGAARVAAEEAASEALPLEELLERIGRRAGVHAPEARRIAEVVLETLAERVAAGVVDDIARHLPEELRPALERGREASGGKAQRLSLDEFVARVAAREGVDYEQALEHARAVLRTLREALPEKELSDLLAELPRAYREALL